MNTAPANPTHRRAMTNSIELLSITLILVASCYPVPGWGETAKQIGNAQVLAPGQEATLAAILGDASKQPIAGCALAGASIEAKRVVARYTCPDVTGETIVELRHPTSAPAGALPAGTAVVIVRAPAPATLGQALAGRLKNHKTGLRWTTTAPGKPHKLAPKELESRDPRAVEIAMAATTEVAYKASVAHVKAKRFERLLTEMMALARKDPHGLVVARLVVACAGVADGAGAKERVDTLIQEAEAQPEDPLSQFVAGVAVHYRGHQTGKTLASKQADYKLALKYLGRTKHKLDQSARYWLYTAVSHMRLGQQSEAETAIAKAAEIDIGTDADVFYCRAEVYHRKNPRKAVEDIKRYREMMAYNKKHGGFSAPEKDQHVEEMLARMQRVVAGDPLPETERLFDPLITSGGLPPLERIIGGGLLLLFALVVAFRKLKR